jgi:hypothetical protein
MNVQWLVEVFTDCFWREPLNATQVCSAAEAAGPTIEFGSRIVGTGGGFVMQKSDWTGDLPNRISDALDANENGSITHVWNGTSWDALAPAVPVYYLATGYGGDPGDPGDTRCLRVEQFDWESSGLTAGVETTVRINFGVAGIAEGTVECGIGE